MAEEAVWKVLLDVPMTLGVRQGLEELPYAVWRRIEVHGKRPCGMQRDAAASYRAFVAAEELQAVTAWSSCNSEGDFGQRNWGLNLGA